MIKLCKIAGESGDRGAAATAIVGKDPGAATARRWPGLLAASLLAAAALGVLLDRVFRPDAFPVEDLRIVGNLDRVDPGALERVIQPLARGNLFAVDLERLEAAAESVPWVHRATVRRQWPRTVVVRVEEQRPVARWGAHRWVNRAGELVVLPEYVDDTLPVLAGPDSTQAEVLDRFRRWRALLEPVGLRLTALTLTSRRVWQARLEPTQAVSGQPELRELRLTVGRQGIDARLERFARVYAGMQSGTWAQAEEIDLRYPNGFSVRWRDGADPLGPGRAAATTDPAKA